MDSDSNDSKGSFVWTDASDDTSNSEIINNSMGQSGEESESGKSFKDKLQKQLFPEFDQNGTYKNLKKRKLSKQDSIADESSSSVEQKRPKKKKIKIEPESDIDYGNLKNDHKSSLNIHNNSVSETYDENYLDEKVRDELNFAVPTPIKVKKKKSKNVSNVNENSVSNGDISQSADTENLSSIHLQYEDSHSSGDLKIYPSEEVTPHRKTKKKKSKSKKKDEDNSSYMEISSIKGSDDEFEFTDLTPSIHQKDMSNKNKKKSNKTENGSNGITDDTETLEVSHSSKRKSKLSDRLMFEDDRDEIDLSTSEITSRVQTDKNPRLKKFIETDNTLRALSYDQMCSRLAPDVDDDLWVVRCPKDLPVEALQGKRWTLDGKCKIKLNGQTYEGGSDGKETNATLASSKSGKFSIENVRISGCVRLRRRIPKPHAADDAVLRNNRTNFIPLPETKCRHPLLGAHYKRALRLAPERDEAISKKKKKKKRKHSQAAEECFEPKPKKRKHDPKSAETWDSAKAIEETLFNF